MAPECEESGQKHEVLVAREVGGGDGKPALLDFFAYLERANALVSTLGGKGTAVLFFLDKDVDDFLNRTVSSEHVVYTEFHSLENYLVAFGSLHESIALATLLDRTCIREHISAENEVWMQRASEAWKEWVKLCLFILLYQLPCENYGVNSRIHVEPYGKIDEKLLQEFRTRLASHWDASKGDFETCLNLVSEEVENIYTKRAQDTIFRGKWYFEFLQIDAHSCAKGRPYRNRGLHDRLRDALLATLDFQEQWSEYFRNRTRTVVTKLTQH